MTESVEGASAEPIAVIGLACRLPGAPDTAAYWRNLIDGVEAVRFYTREEQAALGVPDYLLDDPAFVRASSCVDDYDGLDARFFGMSPREAEVRDPQQRIFLELAHTALEDGGYDPARYDGEVGVYGAIGSDDYQWLYLRPNKPVYASVGNLATFTGNHPDYLATLASYKLDLRGPSVTMHTACSTSLVAVHTACEALRAGECDMALTGGVSLEWPPAWGYVYHPDSIYSPDGHCRTFDAAATGTIWGSGGAMVLLKRLEDAVADGDHIRAVVLGNAINNDGATKAGFSAPSEQGQAAAVAQALGIAGIDSRTVSYVEAHGTGTSLGDPIEVAALSNAFRQMTDSPDAGWCGIGSVKTNIGHLGPAAGIAGLAKTVLAIEHGFIPPSLNFQSPNPKIEFGTNPFYVTAKAAKWETDAGTPRRAGVSSFGIGGTNAHVILEEPPPPPVVDRPQRPVHLIQVSARTATARTAAAERLADHLAENGAALDLADVAHTLREGRAPLSHRAAVVAADPADAVEALRNSKRLVQGVAGRRIPRVALLFSGQGAQYPGMGRELYQVEPVFREAVDECAAILRDELGFDIRELIFAETEEAAERLRQTELTQPALFVIEYALARLWTAWGIEPGGMIGHSIGEYVAATIAGVFRLPDALRLVATRGRLVQSVPPGSMVAVRMDEDEVRPRLPEGLTIATVNGPGACVVAGPSELIKEFSARLAADGVGRTELRTSHAFHSPMMEPILGEFHQAVAATERRAPSLPFLSNVTGEWITAEQAVDPGYWTRHLREPVRFGDCVTRLLAEGQWVTVECGPGRQLAGLVRPRLPREAVKPAHSLPGPTEKRRDLEVLYSAAATLWTAGIELGSGVPDTSARRVPLPAYPFERTRHWIETDMDPELLYPRPARTGALPIREWFNVPVWRQEPPLTGAGPLSGRWAVFTDPADSAGIAGELSTAGADVIRVHPGEAYAAEPGVIRIRPEERDDYDALLAEIGVPDRIVHAWALGDGARDLASAQSQGFHSLLALTQALASGDDREESPVHMDILTTGTQNVIGGDLTRPEHATVEGVAKVVPMELPWLRIRHIDLADTTTGVLAELAGLPLPSGETEDGVPPSPIALRNGRRWTRRYEPIEVEPEGEAPIRSGGVYVITGGIGGIGITLAEDLGRRYGAALVLLGRSGMDGDRSGRAAAAIGRIEAAGGQAMALAADVTDTASLRRVREQAVARFGRIDGIIHAAGVPGGGMAEVKERAAAEAVMAPKLAGTLALKEAFGDLDLDFVMLCSSVTAVAGGFGQVDYCAANSFLDAYAQSAHGWRAPVRSVNWGAWLEVGMAAEVSAPAAFRALQRGDQVTTIEHPILTHVHDGWVSGVVSPETHWELAEHRIVGVPVIAGTGVLEIARAAFEAISPKPGPSHAPELSDVAFVSPISVAEGAQAEIRVRFDAADDGPETAFEVVTLAGEETRMHARGSAAWVPADRGTADIATLREQFTNVSDHDPDRMFASASGLVKFSSRWRSLKQIFEGHGELLARLDAPAQVAEELHRYVLHPALLDEAVSFACMPGEESYLPLGYGKITIKAPLPPKVWTHARQRDTAGVEIVAFDLSLYDDDGNEVAAVSDFVARRIDQAAVTASVGESARRTAEQPKVDQESAAAGNALSVEGEARGIAPAAGADAFRRLLTVDLGAQVVVNAVPLPEFVAGVRNLTAETVEEAIDGPASEDTGADDADYVAPRTEMEATVATLWREVLGATRVGVEDDFFELGGNSLVAVQLIGLFRKKIGVRLPMRSLFETSTVEGMAKLAEEKRQEASSPEEGTAPATEPAIKRQPRIAR